MLEISSAKLEDRYFVARVLRDAIPLYDQIMPGSFERQALKFEKEGFPTTYDVQIIKAKLMPIGFLGLAILSEEIIYMVALYILESQRRSGNGTGTLNQINRLLANKGIREVVLLTHSKASWAIDFYTKNGFEVVTDHLEDIKTYANNKMARYALPSTILLNKKLIDPM